MVSPDGSIFDGLTSFAVYDEAGKTNVGLSPHVTEDGFCSDGCFRLGAQSIASGLFTGTKALPFKSVMTGARFLDGAAGVYYAQGSYPLTPEARCSADDTAQCMLAIDAGLKFCFVVRMMPVSPLELVEVPAYTWHTRCAITQLSC